MRKNNPSQLQFSLVRGLISRIRIAFAFLLLLGVSIVWFFASFYLHNQETQRFIDYLDVLSQTLSEPVQYFDLAHIDSTLKSYSEFLDFDRIQVLDRYSYVQADLGSVPNTKMHDYQNKIMTPDGEMVGTLLVWRGATTRPIGISAFIIGGGAQMLLIVIFGSVIMQFILKRELIEPLSTLTDSIRKDAIDGDFKPPQMVLQRSELGQVAIAYDAVTTQVKTLFQERESLLRDLTTENQTRSLQVRLFEEAIEQSKMALTYKNGASDGNDISFGGWAPPNIRELISSLTEGNQDIQIIEGHHNVNIRNVIHDNNSAIRSFEAYLENGEIWQIRILKLEGDKRAIFASDETSKKQMENALHQKNKLESLGGVSSGVAHDFNNILAIILAALEQIGDDAAINEAAVKIGSDAVERGSSIVKQLLQFVRVGKLSTEVGNLKEIFQKQYSSLSNLLGPSVNLDIAIDADIYVVADPQFLETVFMNLIINARDALGGVPGVISVSQRNPRPKEIRENLLDINAHYVAVDIIDSGGGIPEDVLSRVFDPFFSTKPVGQGTGLGLSMAYEYLRRMGGTIYVSETSSKGTTFSVIMVKTNDRITSKRKFKIKKGDIMKHTSCLLVDDEEALVKFIKIYLERLGAIVTSVHCVNDALQNIESNKFDIVLSDMYMPDGTGIDILTELRKNCDDTKFVLMSGNFQMGIETDSIENAEVVNDLPFIEKPFKLHELNSLMEATLTG